MGNTGKKKHGKKILVVSPTPSHPQNSGNRARIYTLLTTIKSLGHQVHLLYYDWESNHNHIKARPDIKAMAQCWDCFYYMPRHRLDFQGLILKWEKKCIKVIKNNWSVANKLLGFISANAWRITSSITYLVEFPQRIVRDCGQLLKKCYPSIYSELEHHLLGRRVSDSLEGNSESGDECAIDSYYDKRIDNIAPALSKKYGYEIIIAEYIFMSRVLDNFGSDVLRIIDTHDIFTGRREQFKKFGIKENFFTTSKSEEAKGLNRADKIIAIQEEEREYFKKMTAREVVTIGQTVNLAKPIRKKHIRNRALFLGSASSANIHGIRWFINNALPLIIERDSSFKLILAGHISNCVEKHEPIVTLGELKDKTVAYRKSDIVIDPIFLGSGLKIKSIEALGLGKVLICTSHVADSLGFSGLEAPVIAVNSAQEFADQISIIISDTEFCNQISEEAYSFARKYNAWNIEAVKNTLA